jgi:hypothetical protein
VDGAEPLSTRRGPRQDSALFGERYQPHWLWAVCFVLAPFCLTALGFMGIWPQPLIPLGVAESAPRVALVISLIGVGAAIVRRKATAIALAALGFVIALGGYLLLSWLS